MQLLFKTCTGGSVVEFSPATREARVRFPASAQRFHFFSLHSRVLSWQIFMNIHFNKALFFDLSICQFVLLSFWWLWYNRIMMVFNTCILRLSWNWSHDLFINILLNGVVLRDGDKMLPKILIINLNVHNMYMNYQHTI